MMVIFTVRYTTRSHSQDCSSIELGWIVDRYMENLQNSGLLLDRYFDNLYRTFEVVLSIRSEPELY